MTGRPSAKIRLTLGGAAVLSVVLLVGCGAPPAPEPLTAAGPGAAPAEPLDAIDLELPSLDGGSWRLSDERGEVVVLHFFATFDSPSQSLAPVLERTHVGYLHRGARVVGVAMDPGDELTRRQVVETYCSLANLSFEVVLATEELSAGASDVGRIPAIPATILVDREGRPATSLTGIFRQSELEAAIDALLRGR